jgi:flagellar assembly protein FliH
VLRADAGDPAARDRLRRESEEDLVRLAVAIAQRILHRQLSVDPDAITGIIKAGFEKLKRQEICRVRVHPAHQAALCSLLPAGGARQTEVLADPSLQLGGVVFETSRGDLEASVDTQLREIERGLTDRLRSQHD